MIEDILNHKTKIQILNFLSHNEWKTRAYLNRKIGFNWWYLNKHLESLISDDILKIKTVGKTNLYGYGDSERAKYLKQFFIKWRNLNAVSRN